MKKSHLAGLFIILCLLLIKFAVTPLFQWHEKNRAEIVMLEKKISKSKAIWKHRNLLLEKNQELADILGKVIERVPSIEDGNVDSYQLEQQKKIEQAITNTGVAVESISWLGNTKDFFFEIPLKIRGVCSPDAFFKLIHEIESWNTYNAIREIRIRKTGGGQKIDMELTIIFFAIDQSTLKVIQEEA